MLSIWTPARIFVSLFAALLFMVIMSASGYNWLVGLAFGLGVVAGTVLTSLRPN